MQQMPGNVLDDSSVTGENGFGIDDLVFLGGSIDVP